jgi:mycothiol system anti-sigma-R factor
MSSGKYHETSCREALHAIVLYIDQEIDDQESVHALELHLQECPPCAERAAQEALIHQQLRALLNRSCREKASDRLRNNVHAIFRQPYVQWSQSITYTEITTDSFTHTRVEIHELYEGENE